MISVDEPDVNKEFAESLNADFPLLSDPAKGVATAYGVINDERPVPFRWTFIIGPDGKIMKIDKEVQAARAGLDLVAHLGELNVAKK
jgi:peroxiredoxin Q/BCP